MSSTRDGCFDEWRSHDSVERWTKFDAGREGLLRWTASLLPFPTSAPIHVLDIGAGHGLVASQVLDAYTNSTVCLQDFSEAMLREAADRLAAFPGRFGFHRSDLRYPRWAADLSGRFDVVISALVVHNLDQATIRRLYADVFGLLRPGGCFFNLDLILQPPESGVVAGLYRAVEQAAFTHHQDDAETPPPTLEAHLRWLREAGFAEADCVWKQCRQALLCGVRAATVSP